MGSPVLLAASIDFAFSQMEDRILVRCLDPAGGAHHLWLTRRLTRAFLQQFGSLLAITTPAGGVPDAQRQAMVLFEHLDALNDQAALARDRQASIQATGQGAVPATPPAAAPADGAETTPESTSPALPSAPTDPLAQSSQGREDPDGDAPAPNAVLMTRIDVTPQEGRFDLRLFGGEACAVMLPLTRSDAHRLLAVLLRTAGQGEWGLDAEVGWVGDGSRMMQGGDGITVRRH